MTLRRSLFACVIALAALLPAVARAQIPGTANIQINGTNIIGGTSGRCLFDNAGKVGETASCGLAGGITVGTSVITGGTNTRVLFDNAGVLGELAVTGSGSAVLGTSPSVATPTFTGNITTASFPTAVGTQYVCRDGATGILSGSTTICIPSSANTFGGTQTFTVAPVFTDQSGSRTALGLGALATVTPGTGVAAFLATPSSANLIAAITDETGSGAAVFGTSPTIATPTFTGNITTGSFPSGAGTQYVCRDGGTGILSSLATVCNPSDARLKTAWLPLDSVLEKVALLDLGTFDWRDVDQRASAGRQVGLRAQDVARVFPLLVGDEGGTRVIHLDDGSQATVENIRTVDYPKLAVYALKGVQELRAIALAQQAQIARLRMALQRRGRLVSQVRK